MFDLLISPSQLLALSKDNVVIVDCRHQLTDGEYGQKVYAEGHIPSAVRLHLDVDLSGEKTGKNGRHPLPNREAFASKLAKIGISNASQVIAYDDAGGMYAARLWWMLRWLGHDKVAVLDGGIQAYLAAGGLLDAELVALPAAEFVIKPTLEKTYSADDVLSALGSNQLLVVDARAAGRYAGEGETLDPVGGHIPGAKNYFFQRNLDANGCFLSAEVLKQQWMATIENQALDTVVNQCGSGVTACHNLLAQRIAGIAGAGLYPGSWSEWCADASRPVATGTTP